jgi:predicted alpha/beta hydrolase family esterase
VYLSSYTTGYSATASSELAAEVGPARPNGARGVVYAHGAAQTAKDIAGNVFVQPPLFGLAQIPFIAADLAGGTAWGNDACKARMDDAWAYLQSKYKAKADKVLLYGQSMGSLAVLTWALANPTKVAACAVCLPIVNLVDVHDNNRGSFAATIETALGISGTYAGNATITARDPFQNTAAFTFPMKMWISDTDTVGRPADATSFAASVGAPTVSLGSIGHSLSSFVAQDAVDYLKAYA